MIMRWRKVFCWIFLFVGLAMFGMGCSDDDDTDDDHGDDCSTATAVSLNSSRGGVINSGGDYDYFRVNVTSSGTLTVYTTGSTDTYGDLDNSDCTDGRALASNDNGDDDNFSISRSVSAGTYYVSVTSQTTSTGDYTLNVNFADTVSEIESNDTMDTATSVNLNSTCDGSIQPAEDTDYFRVDVTSSGTLTVYTTGSTDTGGWLTDGGGIVNVLDDDSGYSYNFFISHSVNAGTYYLGITGGGTLGDYTLYVEFQ